MRKLLLASLMVVVLAFGVAAGTTDSDTSTFGVGNEEMAVIACSGDAGNLLLVAPAAGAIPTAVNTSESLTYLQYTVVVGATTKEITAQITTEALPLGTLLKITTLPDVGGLEGTAVSATSVTTESAVDVITLIPSCATGIGATDGASVEWELSVSDITLMVLDTSVDITVTFIITDTS